LVLAVGNGHAGSAARNLTNEGERGQTMVTRAQAQGLGEFSRWGFTLEHDGDHFLLLLHQGGLVAHFSQLGATEQSLQVECARHLVNRHGWDGCLWPGKGGEHVS